MVSSVLRCQDINRTTGFSNTTEKRNVQRLSAAVSCLNVSQDPGSLTPAYQNRGTPQRYITCCAITQPSTKRHPHFLENKLYRLSVRQLRILCPCSILRLAGRTHLIVICEKVHRCSQANSLCKGEDGARLWLA